jgi:hypothetical protein
MPFYRGVVQARGRSSVRAAIVVISTAPRAETAKFLALHQLRPDEVMQVVPDAVSIRAVPAIAVADSSGRTLYSRVGVLSQDEEAELVRMLLAGTGG